MVARGYGWKKWGDVGQMYKLPVVRCISSEDVCLLYLTILDFILERCQETRSYMFSLLTTQGDYVR